MRVLVATTAGAGHFAPLVPFAAALRDAGHAVRVAAPASFASAVQRAGFVHVPLAAARPEEIGPIVERLSRLSMEDANAVFVRDVFCGVQARAALPAMQAVADQWRPDLILRETAEFASFVVAERRGIPHAQVAMSLASVEAFMHALVDGPLRALGTEGVAGIVAGPRLTLLPAVLDGPGEPAVRPTYRFRLPMRPAPAPDLPRTWWPGSEAPLVYVTFGSVAAGIGFFPDFYRAMLAELADLPVRIMLTLGEAGDPERLAPVPSNVDVERWWPQEQVMASAAAMVTHAGFGTTLLGLTAGLPMVVVPLFALDQYVTARRIQAVGAGIDLEDRDAAPARVRAALEQVLTDGLYRTATRHLAGEIAQLPHPSTCVPVLEALVQHGPLTRPAIGREQAGA
ncbi:MAG: glycosyltransferase family 1 protein [Chloroflexi bacterium]|nr:glycosyltransferase family 1 protein [Chloroflexota bacterium]